MAKHSEVLLVRNIFSLFAYCEISTIFTGSDTFLTSQDLGTGVFHIDCVTVAKN